MIRNGAYISDILGILKWLNTTEKCATEIASLQKLKLKTMFEIMLDILC